MPVSCASPRKAPRKAVHAVGESGCPWHKTRRRTVRGRRAAKGHSGARRRNGGTETTCGSRAFAGRLAGWTPVRQHEVGNAQRNGGVIRHATQLDARPGELILGRETLCSPAKKPPLIAMLVPFANTE